MNLRRMIYEKLVDLGVLNYYRNIELNKLVQNNGKMINSNITDEIDISGIIKDLEYSDTIEKFENALQEQFKECDLSAFYNNIKTLSFTTKIGITDAINMFLGEKFVGYYNPQKNSIKIKNKSSFTKSYSKEEKEDALNHELLHMATFENIGNINLCGFQQFNLKNNEELGRCVNEGYTEYLNTMYITKNYKSINRKSVVLAEGIETIIGKEKMLKLFFSKDLKGLINELENYCDNKTYAYTLIAKMDKYYNGENEKNKKEELKDAQKIMLSMFEKKQYKRLINGEITQSTYDTNCFLSKEGFLNNGALLEDATILEINFDKLIYEKDGLKNTIDYNRIRRETEEKQSKRR